MIVDSSAIVAIAYSEPESARCIDALELAPYVAISAANYLEAAIVIDSSSNALAALTLDTLISLYNIAIEPVTEAQARIARLAYRTYGKGRGHPAQLNFGDCFAYALARDRNDPLLFVGDDFGHTDIRSALGS